MWIPLDRILLRCYVGPYESNTFSPSRRLHQSAPGQDALRTRTTRETIDKALDLAIAWEETTDDRPLTLFPQQQRRLHLFLDSANVGKLTDRESEELDLLIRVAQLLTVRKARLLADSLTK